MKYYELDDLLSNLGKLTVAAQDARKASHSWIGELPSEAGKKRYKAAISRIKLLKQQFYVLVENLEDGGKVVFPASTVWPGVSVNDWCGDFQIGGK